MTSIISDWIDTNARSIAYQISPEIRREIDHQAFRVLNRLKWAGRNSPNLRDLTDRLELCRWPAPCLSGACCRCIYLVSRTFEHMTMNFAQRTSENPLSTITVIIGTKIVPMGELNTIYLHNLKRKLNYHFDKAGLELLIGCLEFSVVESLGGDLPAAWMPHFHGLAISENAKNVRRQLRHEFPTSDRVVRPIKIQTWDGRREWPRYCVKLETLRRLSGVEENRVGTRVECRRVATTWRLQSSQLAELCEFLDSSPIDSRLFQRSAQIRKGKNGPVIR